LWNERPEDGSLSLVARLRRPQLYSATKQGENALNRNWFIILVTDDQEETALVFFGKTKMSRNRSGSGWHGPVPSGDFDVCAVTATMTILATPECKPLLSEQSIWKEPMFRLMVGVPPTPSRGRYGMF